MNPNQFHWTDSCIESIKAEGSTLIIVANHVLVDNSDTPTRIKLSFFDVSHTSRKTTEYLRASKDINSQKASCVVNDIDRELSTLYGKKYYIEGVTEFEPKAWLEWDLIANQHLVKKID